MPFQSFPIYFVGWQYGEVLAIQGIILKYLRMPSRMQNILLRRKTLNNVLLYHHTLISKATNFWDCIADILDHN